MSRKTLAFLLPEEKAWENVERYLSIVTSSIENLAARVDEAREVLAKWVG